MKTTEVQTLSLPQGKVLTITTDASGKGAVTQLNNSAGGPNTVSPVQIPVSSTQTFGPFNMPTRWLLSCVHANMDYAVSDPDLSTVSEKLFSVSYTPTAVGAQGVSVQTVAVPGVQATDKVAAVSGPATGNNTAICGARVSGANQIDVAFTNPTAGALTPAAGTFSFFVVR